MPIISRIGRRDPKVVALYAGMYAVLILGAVTMIYPFLIMVSGSMKSAVDIRELDPAPRFLYNDAALYRKHVEGLFNEQLDAMRIAYDLAVPAFDQAEPPPPGSRALAEAWEGFLEKTPLPPSVYTIGYVEAVVSRTLPMLLREFKGELVRRYRGRIEDMNRALSAEFVGWNAFRVQPEDYLPRRREVADSPMARAFTEFKERQPRGLRYYFVVEGFFKKLFLETQYSRDIGRYNEAHGTRYASYGDIRLTRRLPGGTAQERSDWEAFVRNTLNLLWIRVAPEARPEYQAFLEAKYADIKTLNRNYGTRHAAFSDVPLIEEPPSGGLPLSDWAAFIAGWKDPDSGRLYTPKAEQLRVHSLEFLFRDYLKETYGDIAALNGACGTSYRDFDEVYPPQRQAHYEAFLAGRGALRWEFATRNYRTVADFMLVHGRGIVNTVIYCALAVLCALIFNPLAAYALSRYRLANTYKILLFMLVTMAFPPMVTQIPVFLMMRDFNLLNTFAALVLPGLAHGYSIFLLKGFFDSQPRELYESAQIDGAGEWTIFWQITMSLSKPILAVVALQAFNIAYSNFMFALLICQDEKMWTLMVWLYQLQQRSGQAVIYASLLIAAIPTFIIFLFCQNVILRGIVVPVEK